MRLTWMKCEGQDWILQYYLRKRLSGGLLRMLPWSSGCTGEGGISWPGQLLAPSRKCAMLSNIITNLV